MRAFVVQGPGEAGVELVEAPESAPGQVVVDVERVGICGTDVEFFTGEMAYLHQGLAEYPMRLGHEWVGRVSALGQGVDPSWLGRRVTADTMLGCGKCERCLTGRRHLCARRHEIGIRGGWPGALAEQLPVPESALHEIPETMSDEAAALVEPGANAVRVVASAPVAGERVLVFGPGTIGLLVAQFALAAGAEVHVVGIEERSLEMARDLGVEEAVFVEELRGLFDVVVDATNDSAVPAETLQWVEPGGHVVLIGLSGEPSSIDSREVVIGDLTVTGVLSGSGGIPDAIKAYTSGAVMPDAMVAEVVTLGEVADRLRGERGASAGPGPKIQVDPRAV
jgi:2-desacetyl-2-hydroxyethyl bacteriochlorophyllide A dehydrogenase